VCANNICVPNICSAATAAAAAAVGASCCCMCVENQCAVASP
jgi:hypothetical protein